MKSFLRPIRGWQGHFIKARSQVFDGLPIDVDSIDEIVVIDRYSLIDGYYFGFVYFNDSTYYGFSKRYRDSLEIAPLQKMDDTQMFILESLHKNDIEAIIRESEANRVTSGNTIYITHMKKNDKGKLKAEILEVPSFIIPDEIEKFFMRSKR